MKLKDLERDISLVEESISQMKSINRDVARMESQVVHVRDDMLHELNVMERNANQSLRGNETPN